MPALLILKYLGFLILLITGVSIAAQEVKVSESEGIQLYNDIKKLYLEYEGKHGGWVQTKNVNMHYLQWGEDNATPLIWAIGTYSSAYELSATSGDLVEAGLRVIAIDYYGHGPTEIPEHDVSVYHFADDIAELMDSLGIEKAYIGGWSRGGYLATAFFSEYPDKVMGLLLGDGGLAHIQSDLDNQTDAEILDKYSSSHFPKIEPEDSEYLLFYNTVKMWPAGPPSSYLPLFSKIRQDKNGKWIFNIDRLRRWLGEDSKERFLESARLTSKTPMFQGSFLTMNPEIIYRNLNVPVLVFDPVSENDRYPMTKHARYLKEQHGDLVTHKIYENTGHGFFFEHPARFVKDVIGFVDVQN